MKNIVCEVLIIMLFITNVSCIETNEKQRLKINLTDYQQREISVDEYKYSQNWKNFVRNDGKLKIAYKIEKIDNTINMDFLTDIIYFLERNNEIIFLGRLSIENGFQNAFGENFVADKNLKINSEFMEKSLVGFSIDCIKFPFFIRGLQNFKIRVNYIKQKC